MRYFCRQPISTQVRLPYKLIFSKDSKRIHSVILHEVGHALGIQEHSSNANDVMFPGSCSSFGPEQVVLTKRDLETISRIYKPSCYLDAALVQKQYAAAGNPFAQCALGLIFENGSGVKQNFSQAADWYRKAADQGFVDAEINLGAMYEHGHGVKQDYSQAVQWYRKAADQGCTEAKQRLKLLRDKELDK